MATSFIPPFMVSALFFVVFLLTFQLFRITKIIVNKGVAADVIFILVGHIAVTFLPIALPLSALFATMFSLNHLSEDSEIVAMRSFGLRKSKLLFPYLFCGFFIALAIYSVNISIIPNSKTQFTNTVIRLTSKGMVNDIRPEVFFTEIPGITLFAEKVENGGEKLENVFIQVKKGKNSQEQVIMARQGSLLKMSEGENEGPNMRLKLNNGNIVKITSKKDDMEKILFRQYDFPLFEKGYRPGFVSKDSMKSSTNLRRSIRIRKNYIKELKKTRPKTHPDIQNILKGLVKAKLEYWSRINTPLLVLVFILLGFGMGIKKGREQNRNTGSMAMLILSLYYAFFFLGISMARKGNIPAEVAVFLPTFLVALVGYRIYSKLDWLS